MSKHIQIEQDAGVLVVTLNRPKKKNALTLECYTALRGAMRTVAESEDSMCLLLRGSGGDFTAGNDLADFMGRPDQLGEILAFLHELVEFPSPLVVAVRGLAIGIGSTLLMHADTVVASENASFRMPFTKLGLVPEAGSSILLSQTGGTALASDLLLSSRYFNTEEAMRLGLVSRMRPDDDVDGEAMRAALELTALPPGAVRSAKDLIREPMRDALHEAIDREGEEFARCLASEGVQNLLKEFLIA